MSRKMIVASAATGALMLGASSAVAQTTGGVINVGAAFGSLAPYVDSIVGVLIVAGLTWLFMILKTKFNIDTDASFRAALQTFLKNQASSLIADGAVAISDKGISVKSPALASAANMAFQLIPETLKRFGLTPDVVAQKIIDMIPQTEAGAAIIAAQAAPPAAVVVTEGKPGA